MSDGFEINTRKLIRWRERTNKMPLIRCLLSNFLSQHVSGIIMPETCWDRKFDNKYRISYILLVLSLHLMFTMHGHKNLKQESSLTRLCIKHCVCFRSRLAKFETEFDANPLLLHISHCIKSVRSPNSTNTAPQKCTEKAHTSSQQNAALQNGSKRVQLAIPGGTQLYQSGFRAGFQFRALLSSILYCVSSSTKLN